MNKRWAATVLAALAATGLRAQQPPAAPDPARLAAGRALVDAALPPATREAMIRGIVGPMVENVRTAMANSPQMAELVAKQPGARDVLDRYMQRIVQTSLEGVQAAMPKLAAAMAQAYARHLTLAQLNDTLAFYQTASGRALVASLPTIQTDPAVLQVQREMMADTIAKLPAQVKQLQAEMAALGKPQ